MKEEDQKCKGLGVAELEAQPAVSVLGDQPERGWAGSKRDGTFRGHLPCARPGAWHILFPLTHVTHQIGIISPTLQMRKLRFNRVK